MIFEPTIEEIMVDITRITWDCGNDVPLPRWIDAATGGIAKNYVHSLKERAPQPRPAQLRSQSLYFYDHIQIRQYPPDTAWLGDGASDKQVQQSQDDS